MDMNFKLMKEAFLETIKFNAILKRRKQGSTVTERAIVISRDAFNAIPKKYSLAFVAILPAISIIVYGSMNAQASIKDTGPVVDEDVQISQYINDFKRNNLPEDANPYLLAMQKAKMAAKTNHTGY